MGIRRNIGIDLGTANTLVYQEGQGIVLDEPSVLALDPKERKIIAMGQEAADIISRGGEEFFIVQPLEEGVVSDFEMTKNMLSYYIKNFYRWKIFKPNIVMCVPSGVTEVESRALWQVVKESGGADVRFIEEPTAIALGEEYDPMDPKGLMIIDIGGGTTEVGVLSYGRLIIHESLRVAGNHLDRAIRRRVKREFKLDISILTAEKIKIELLSALNKKHDATMTFTGRDLASGLPQDQTLSGYKVFVYCEAILTRLMDMLVDAIQSIPPQLMEDVKEKGILLAGGGALVPHMDERIEKLLGIKVNVAENPLTSTAVGAGKAIHREDVIEMGRVKAPKLR